MLVTCDIPLEKNFHSKEEVEREIYNLSAVIESYTKCIPNLVKCNIPINIENLENCIIDKFKLQILLQNWDTEPIRNINDLVHSIAEYDI